MPEMRQHPKGDEWWYQEPYRTHLPLRDWFDIEAIVAESRRRTLDEVGEMMEGMKLLKEDDAWNTKTIRVIHNGTLDEILKRIEGMKI